MTSTTPDLTTDPSYLLVEQFQKHALREITRAAGSLDRALTETLTRATDAKSALRSGQRVSAMISVLGNGPRTVETAAARLEDALSSASAAGCTDEQIMAAYTDRRLW